MSCHAKSQPEATAAYSGGRFLLQFNVSSNTKSQSNTMEAKLLTEGSNQIYFKIVKEPDKVLFGVLQ